MKKLKSQKRSLFNKIRISYLFVNVLVFMSLTSFSQTMNHGFKLIEKRFVKEVNADCYYYEHVKSGAKLLKIASTDDNKTFGITFKTLPDSDNGVAHILEHSVLNGSKNFPVKSPFDILGKGSLNTFLNAMTSRDATTYPFASMNDKDYFNLMYVYLDAVFNPRIFTDPRILKQEGWHYELTDKDSAIEYKGVVYNEMKGAFSNPQREQLYQNLKNIFPDNAYGRESGGLPGAITTLTQTQFIDFYKKYYHPENSYIFLYGNANLDKELEFIDQKYLSNYTRTGNKVIVNDQKPFAAAKEVTAFYPIMEDGQTAGQTFLSLNFAAGHNTDYSLGLALNAICYILVNQESAPIRIALQKAGIGKDVSASVQNFNQNLITISVQNANVGDNQKFKNIVINALEDAVKKGIDKEDIQGIINQYEFYYREGNDAQKGITYMDQIRAGWLFGNDPFIGLEYEKQLTEIKKSLTTNYLESLIQKYFLNNPHSALVSLEPKPGLDNERNSNTEKELKLYKDKLKSAEIDSLIKQTNDLIAFQKREDTPEAIATIPMLALSDINPKVTYYYKCEEKNVEGSKLLHYDDFTNGILYSNLNFDMRVLPEELIPYASLLSKVLGKMNTEKYTFGVLNRNLNIHLGDFNASLNTYPENDNDNQLLPLFTVSTKMMNTKVEKMFELTSEIILKSNLQDTARLKEVLSRHQSQIESSFKRNGYGVASKRLSSYYSNLGLFNELTGGLDYYWFLTDLVKNFDKKAKEITGNLIKVSQLLFVQENLMSTVTCSKKDLDIFSKDLNSFKKLLSAVKPTYNTWQFNLEKKNEGILTASKVQFVVEGYDFNKLGYTWNGKMRVLNQILSTDYLHNQVRVIGGAYGGFCSFNRMGMVSFSSYRDPNLKSTIDIYNGIPDYLNKFDADEKSMTRYIIGTISDLDVPYTPQQKGNNAFTYFLTKRTNEAVQKERDMVLSTKPEDIRAFSKMVKDILEQKALCVYGNSDKIQAEKESFNKLIKIEVE
jgi:Zn-dependent M16 (insulinase) family peptidase